MGPTLPLRDRLEELKRPELIRLCKLHKVKCTGKNVELIEKLLDILDKAEEASLVLSEAGIEDKENNTEADNLHQTDCEENGRASLGVAEDAKIPSNSLETCAMETEERADRQLVDGRGSNAGGQESAVSIEPSNQQDSPVQSGETAVRKPGKPAIHGQSRSQTGAASNPCRLNQKATTSNAPSAAIKKVGPAKPVKFDLKASLQRPLSYKPYTGPLKPFQ